MISFTKMKVGDSARIVGYNEESNVVNRLKSLGLVRGTSLTVTRIAPMGDPFEIRVRGYNLGIRQDEGETLRLVVA